MFILEIKLKTFVHFTDCCSGKLQVNTKNYQKKEENF